MIVRSYEIVRCIAIRNLTSGRDAGILAEAGFQQPARTPERPGGPPRLPNALWVREHLL